MGVQLAKWKGARVVGTASAANADFLRQLGVDELFDYKTGQFEDKARGVDLVFDTAGGETLARSFAVVRKGGRLVTIAGWPTAEEGRKFGIEVAGISVRRRRHFRSLASLIKPDVRMPVGSERPLLLPLFFFVLLLRTENQGHRGFVRLLVQLHFGFCVAQVFE
jgi:NADPH:quinone reductase-like Zn-dependent oxidoreductase